MENKPGTGYTPPFGNENGATVAGGGPTSGAHDFLTDPASNAPKTGGRDFTRESRPQRGGPPGYNAESVPSGGPLPFPAADPKGEYGPDGAQLEHPTSPRKPFRVSEPAAGTNVQPPTMAGDVPDEGY